MSVKTILLRTIISLFVLICIFIGSFIVWRYISINKDMDVFTKRIVNKAMNKIIEYDQNARRFYMLQNGSSEIQIENTLRKLQSKYVYEREKMWKYCYGCDERCCIYTDYHKLLFPDAYIVFNYKFDTDSKEFFDQNIVIEYSNKAKLTKMVGINYLKYHNREQPFLESRDYQLDGGIEFSPIKKLHSDEIKNYYIKEEGLWK